MKRIVALAAVSLLLVVPSARGQNQPQTPLTAEQILDKHIEALGGRESIAHISTLVEKGALYGDLDIEYAAFKSPPIPDQHGLYEEYWKAPNKEVVRNVLPKGEVRIVCDGTNTWIYRPELGVREEKNPQGCESRWEQVVNWRSRSRKVELKGIKTYRGRSAYEIRIYPEKGDPWTLYYDTETFLLLGSRLAGPVRWERWYSDYREVAGVKIPFKRSWSIEGRESTLTITSVQANVLIDDSVFGKPRVK